MSWPIPQTVKELRGFLGPSGYYRRFVRNYGTIAKPLTDLLKKNEWGWTSQAGEVFQALKHSLSTALVLILSDFHNEFYIETDASSLGVGAVLQQQGHPIAFFSKAFGVRH